MSSTRRSANEVNILDMLDRQASGPLPRRVLRKLRRFLGGPALVWYGVAGLLVCGLVGTLAWLARDGTPASVDTVLAGPITPAAPAPGAASETVGNPPLVASAAEPPLEPTQDAAPAAGASIVDVAPPEPDAAVHAAPAPVHALPQQQASGRIAAHEVERDPPRLAAPVPVKAGPRTGHAAPLAHPGPAAPRNRRQAAARTPAAAPSVDTDVALISAIIQHANARQEAEEAACAEKGCGARKP
jgi:hypothetical protein